MMEKTLYPSDKVDLVAQLASDEAFLEQSVREFSADVRQAMDDSDNPDRARMRAQMACRNARILSLVRAALAEARAL